MNAGQKGAQPPAQAARGFLAGLLVGLTFAVIGVALGMWALMGGGMMGGGTMGGAPTGSGILALVLAVAFLATAAVAVGRGLQRRAPPDPGTPPPSVAPAAVAAAPAEAGTEPGPAAPPEALASSNEIDALTLPLLDRDERLLYIEVKEKGRSALQKDLGHRDGFSRSKVTRTLDRLEAKGLIARERDGMTNRVRLTRRGGGPS